MFASNLSHRDRKPKYMSKFWTKHGGDGKQWPLTPFPFLASWPSRPPAIEMPPRPVPAGPLASFHDPRTHHVLESHPEQATPLSRRDDDTPSALTPPLHCASILQPVAPPQIMVVVFESWTISAPICLNRFTFAESWKPDLWACVCVFTFSSSAFAFLIEMNFSFKSLFAIWSLSPQRFHYYFCLSIDSWQYQKYSNIPILVLCLLCVTPLVCSSYSSFPPSSHFFISWWQKDCELFTHTLVFQCCPSTLSRQPQTTHVFANSRIILLCRALRICVPHAPTESYPFSLLVRWAFRACYRSHHHASLPQNWSVQTSIPEQPLWAPPWSLWCSLASSFFTPRKSLFLSDDRLNSRM